MLPTKEVTCDSTSKSQSINQSINERVFNAVVSCVDMKLIVDFIPNHTGWNHPWFVASNISGDPATNPYWNYYVWGDCSATNWVQL